MTCLLYTSINAGNKQITNVAPGRIAADSTDAVNGSQLHEVKADMNNKINHLNGQVNKLGKRVNAGTASALAASQLPQAYIPGKSMVSVAAGNYQGQNAVALGMSRISDNGKIIIRLAGTSDTQGKVGVAAVSYTHLPIYSKNFIIYLLSLHYFNFSFTTTY